jgi:uncharacterized membrane protein YdjX (TVP38/TMEM64 family)
MVKRSNTRVVGGLLAFVGIVVASFFLPADDWALGLAGWIRGAGLTGAAAFVGVYVLGAALLLPGSLLTLTAGFAYGPVVGTLVAWPAATLAATIAFLIGRFVARDWVHHRVATHPRFAAIDRAIGRNGFKIVFLLRLSPVFPYNLLNYGLGLTSVPVHLYAAASLLGMLPGAALFAYLGSLVTSAASLAHGAPDVGPVRWVLYGVGFVATASVTVLLTRIARRELGKSLEPAVPSPRPE